MICTASTTAPPLYGSGILSLMRRTAVSDQLIAPRCVPGRWRGAQGPKEEKWSTSTMSIAAARLFSLIVLCLIPKDAHRLHSDCGRVSIRLKKTWVRVVQDSL